MPTKRVPFYERDYDKENEHYCPNLEVSVGGKKTPIVALADTGCDAGISIFKENVEELGLDLGDKINTEPVRFSVADGHLIGSDVYESTVRINDEKKEILIFVVDPEILGYKPEKISPLIGRDLLDKFDVLFKGDERKIVLMR